MKKVQKIVALFLVAAVMTLAGCEKENNTNNNSNSQPQPRPEGISLAGTSWECNIETEYYQQGIQILINAQQIMDFNDEVNGEIFVDFTQEVPIAPRYNQHQTMTEPVIYYFYNNTLTLTSTGEDAVEGDEGTMIYHPEDTTFHMIVDDAQAAAILGDEIVFHLTRGTINF
ncbi:MAG: hypothetical protein J6V98_04295 [Bacteroidales bacterium]|nr:hypothetical protein [Bacteroidales bacterium]